MNAAHPTPHRLDARLTGAFCLLLTLALLFGALPYRGIRHDAILYMGQALSHLNPGWSASDLFFATGSQDQFSIFSTMMAWLMRHADAAVVDMTLLRGAWLVWIAALFALARDFPARERWLAVLAVVAASHYYGTTRVFGFMEPFVTARTWAEPVVLLALAALLRGRLSLAVAAFLLAMLLHPLVALPVGAVALAYLVSIDRRWAALLLLLLPMIGLAGAGVAPFSALLRTYDPEWFQATLMANDIVYVSNWYLTDAVAALAHAALLWWACRGSQTPLARLGRATVAAAPILFLASFIGADLLHNVLITQLQLWRVTWILDLLTLLSLPTLLVREWQRGPKGRCAALAVFVAAYAIDDWIPTGWMLVCWATLALALSASKAEVKPSVLNLANVVTVLVGLGVVVLQWFNVADQLGMHSQGMRLAEPLSILFTLPLLALPVAFGLTVLWAGTGAARIVAAAAVAGLLVLAATHWDQRTPWARYVESARPGVHPFDAFIPPDAQVYWHEDTAATWVLLQRANFISSSQTSGLLFNRATALTAVQRVPPLLSVMANRAKCSSLERFGAVALERGACTVPRDSFLALCNARPTHPDFLVASADFGTGVIARWRFAPDDGSAATTYVLYDCTKMR
jgi:hypothetical protein